MKTFKLIKYKHRSYLGVVVNSRHSATVIVLLDDVTKLQPTDCSETVERVSAIELSFKSGGMMKDATAVSDLMLFSVSESDSPLTEEVLAESACEEETTLVESFARLG